MVNRISSDMQKEIRSMMENSMRELLQKYSSALAGLRIRKMKQMMKSV
jgi:hypothetical protein